MWTKLPTDSERELQMLLNRAEHDAWMAYRREKYGPDAPDLCCDHGLSEDDIQAINDTPPMFVQVPEWEHLVDVEA